MRHVDIDVSQRVSIKIFLRLEHECLIWRLGFETATFLISDKGAQPTKEFQDEVFNSASIVKK